MALPYPEKPIDQIRSKHRGRTRRKREFKGRLAETVLHNCRRRICA